MNLNNTVTARRICRTRDADLLTSWLCGIGHRKFSGSCRRPNHYETLKVPHTASKGQIKSSYYQLSKRYHPDVNKDPKENAIYPSLRQAYDVLIDDRRRRAYDRSMKQQPVPAGSGAAAAGTAHSHQHWYGGHRRTATYAWEKSRRPGAAHHSHPHESPFRPPPRNQHQYRSSEPDSHTYPFSSPQGRQRSPAQQRWDAEQEAMDRVKSISKFWRNVVIVGAGVLVYSLRSDARA